MAVKFIAVQQIGNQLPKSQIAHESYSPKAEFRNKYQFETPPPSKI